MLKLNITYMFGDISRDTLGEHKMLEIDLRDIYEGKICA